jgi:hypothetical protein
MRDARSAERDAQLAGMCRTRLSTLEPGVVA